MAVKPRPEWTAVEIASHAMEATSLSQLTLPEVKKLAARVLQDQGKSPESNATELEGRRIATELSERLDASNRR